MTSRYNPTCHVPGWVIVSAVRYARGRATYIVGMIVDMKRQKAPSRICMKLTAPKTA